MAPELMTIPAHINDDVTEEVGHHLTSVGYIIDQSTINARQQEKKVRFVD